MAKVNEQQHIIATLIVLVNVAQMNVLIERYEDLYLKVLIFLIIQHKKYSRLKIG